MGLEAGGWRLEAGGWRLLEAAGGARHCRSRAQGFSFRFFRYTDPFMGYVHAAFACVPQPPTYLSSMCCVSQLIASNACARSSSPIIAAASLRGTSQRHVHAMFASSSSSTTRKNSRPSESGPPCATIAPGSFTMVWVGRRP